MTRSRELFSLLSSLLPLLIAALVVRMIFLAATRSVIDADEAIVGLMARDVIEGRPWPIFYYGQHYMGSLEALLTALVFLVLGEASPVTMHAVPVFFSLLFVLFVYLLALRISDRRGAFVAGMLAALPPLAFLEWSTKSRGGFIELVALGTLSLLQAVIILQTPRPRSSQFILLGLVLGVAWWVNNQAIFYLLSITLTFVLLMPRQIGFSASSRAALICGISFLVGGLPFWWANFLHTPRFATFKELGQRAGSMWDLFDHLGRYFTEALPILLGARRFWQVEDLFPGAAFVVLALYLFVVIVSARRRDTLPLLVMLFVVPLVFASSHFGWLTKAPRYLLPLYSALFPLAGVAAWHLGPRAGTLLAAALLALNVRSAVSVNGVVVPGQPFVSSGERVAEDHTALYRFLEREGYRHIFTNYWIGYRVAFETGERVTFSIFDEPRSRRIERYEMEAQDEVETSPYVLVPAQAARFKAYLAETGYLFRETAVGGYVVVDLIRPVVFPGKKLDLSRAVVTATSRQEWLHSLIDGDPGTRWGSGKPQSGDMSIEVRLAEPTLVSSVVLRQGFWPQDAARQLTIELELENGDTCTVFSGEVLPYLADSGNRLQVNFEPRNIRALRLLQQGTDAVFDWSVAEIELFSPGSDLNESGQAIRR